MKTLMIRAVAATALIGALALPFSAQAHRQWLLPSSTVLSGDQAWVGVDAGISNIVFVSDHAAMRLDNLHVTGPDGAAVQPEHVMQGQYRSTFDVHLTQPGTYRIANESAGVVAAWMLDGQPGRWRGPASGLAAAVPAGATDVVSAPNSSRLETFVTLGDTTTTVFQPTGEGLEMVPVTHPNDVVMGEPATFQLMKDGRPLQNATVTVAPGGIRYRDNPEEFTLTTGADGRFTVNWPQAGMYWINAVWRPDGVAPPAPMEGPRPPAGEGGRAEGGRGGPPTAMAQYTLVVEVLP